MTAAFFSFSIESNTVSSNVSHIDSLSRLFSLTALCVVAGAAYILVDLIPVFFPEKTISYLLIAVLEGILVLQLILAWGQSLNRLSLPHLYLFFMLFGLRLLYRLSGNDPVMWGLRMGAVHNAVLGLILYGVGIVRLHPAMFQFSQKRCQVLASSAVWIRLVLAGGLVLFMAFLFRTFPSSHITRDGFDWIQRTALEESVWHLYMREPLTIWLYRTVFLFGWERFEMTSADVIATLSILAGVWWTAWFLLFVRERMDDIFDCMIALTFALASGGMLVLFFGHIEVYPIFIAAVMPAFYFVQRYFNGKGGLSWAALSFSIAFLFHLSAGWLLPALVLLPFLNRQRESWKKDVLTFWGAFSIVQVLFWGSLLVFCYSSSVDAILARLHVTFNVGLDKRMFLPQWLWFHPLRLIDLFNEYLYLSIPCVVLSPLALFYGWCRRSRETLFWMVAAAGFFIYSFFWNPDRGFPEDWDLFSALPFFGSLFLIHLFLPASNRDGENDSAKTELTEQGRTLIYIAAFGCFPFACSQVWYHYCVPFVSAAFR